MTASRINTTILVIAILLSCCAATAQSDTQACSSRTNAWARTTSSIRQAPSHTAALVRHTAPNEKLDILSSQRQGPWCWLQVNDGWILDSGLASSAQEVTQDSSAADGSYGAPCFAGDRVWISGSMNIRASARASALVTGAARAGDELAVADSQRGQDWCWLKVEDGWIARTSRVHAQQPAVGAIAAAGGSSTQTTAQQPASRQVDNCCFVDRQCHSEQEWADGYWAYQHGQCPAPQQPASAESVSAQPVTLSSPQPSAGGRPQPLRPESVILQLPWSATDWSLVNAPGVDNCCKAGWDCQNETEWQRGFHMHQVSKCHHSGVPVIGSANFRSLFEAAYNLMLNHAPHWYAYAVRGMFYIEQLPADAQGGMHPDTRAYVQEWQSDDYMWNDNDLYLLLSNLVHEACHMHMWNRELDRPHWSNELPCVESQLYVTEALDPQKRYSGWLRNLIANMHDPAYWWW